MSILILIIFYINHLIIYNSYATILNMEVLYMTNDNKPQKRISDIIRKLLTSSEVSIKKAALYLDCTEQSFRNKLSRDSFSLRDLIILCYLCNARLILEYDSQDTEDELEFFNPSEYLPENDYKRIHKIQEQNLKQNFANMMIQLSKEFSEEELEKMSSKELLDLLIQSTKKKASPNSLSR